MDKQIDEKEFGNIGEQRNGRKDMHRQYRNALYNHR